MLGNSGLGTQQPLVCLLPPEMIFLSNKFCLRDTSGTKRKRENRYLGKSPNQLTRPWELRGAGAGSRNTHTESQLQEAPQLSSGKNNGLESGAQVPVPAQMTTALESKTSFLFVHLLSRWKKYSLHLFLSNREITGILCVMSVCICIDTQLYVGL